MKQVRVALADDHPLVLMGIKALIEAEPKLELIGTATNGRAALEVILETRPDVAVMDISMPEMDGIELVREVKRAGLRTKILALTVHEDEGYLHLALKAGVDGYILKRSAAEDLIRAIRCVVADNMYLDPAIAAKAIAPAPKSSSSASALSEREADVLSLLAKGYTTKEIADRLAISAKTVETYKSRAAEKLNLRTRVQIVRFAAAQGWLAEI